jgi:hypothetical protein
MMNAQVLRAALRFVSSVVAAVVFPFLSPWAAADTLPTPEQLVALVQAGRSQYRSMDVQFEVNQYKYASGEANRYPAGSAAHIWRATDSRSYSRAVMNETDAAGNVVSTATVTYAFAPTWSKRLDEPQRARPSAVIQRSEHLKSEVEMHPAAALWAPQGERIWNDIADGNSSVSRDGKTGNFVLVFAPEDSKTRSVITVDPTHGYLPVRTELQRADGTLVMSCAVLDLRQVEDGLWFPFTYTAETYTTEPAHYESVFVVKTAHVNTEIPDEMLDIRFPSGTGVSDQIANLRYVVDDVGDPQNAISAPGVTLSPEDISVAHPASDAALSAIGRRITRKGTVLPGAGPNVRRFLLYGFTAGLSVLVVVWSVQRRRSHAKA